MKRTTKTTKTTTTASFYARRAAKIAAARAANKAQGLSVREQRAIARDAREFLMSVAGL